MNLNIQNILKSLINDFSKDSDSTKLTVQETAVKNNIREILLGYNNGTTVTENELLEGECVSN
jgi:hypothetical protein